MATGETDTDELRRRLQAALGDDFTVEESLGEGGFALVFAALDRKLSRRIAIKVLRPELTASPSSKQRFVREAESVARLSHPHIMPIFFVGEGQALVYFGMPLVEGETLETRIRREGPLPEREVARIGAEIADALAEAHAAGLVHRDIKPLNVMLQGTRGRVLVADFGIAKAAAGSGESLTGTGIAIGSPHYMSPEQASGAESVDGRSDIYSLGIVLWQMLAGRLPFQAAESRAVLMQQVTRDLPRLRELRPDVSPQLAAVVEKCTEKDPRQRFQTAEQLSHALHALAAAPGRRPRALLPALAAVLAVAALLGLAALWAWRATRRPTGTGAVEALPASALAPATTAPVIAVLPLTVVTSGDTAQFARAAALMLSEALNLRNGVTTVDPNQLLGRWIAEQRRTTAPPAEQARFAYGLGANQVIMGNYLESGRSFRIAATMYDTHDASRLWSDEVTGSTDSLFSLIDRLAARAAVALCGQPDYNPGGVCYDAPARPTQTLAVAGAAADSSPRFFARISPAGEVVDVRIARPGADPELASRALELVYAARFSPARKGGHAVAAWATVDVAVRAEGAGAADAGGPARTPGAGAGAAAEIARADPRCESPEVGARNPGGACFDARPVPIRLPLVPPPSACGRAPSAATVLVRVGADGRVSGRPSITKASDCSEFSDAALAAAAQIDFVPAQKQGRAVAAWTLILVRPAVLTAAATTTGGGG